MKYTKSKYPIRATWKGKDKKTGNIGYIWLDERRKYFEIWRWSWLHLDELHPTHSFGWGTSYRMCREDLLIDCRMKRIK